MSIFKDGAASTARTNIWNIILVVCTYVIWKCAHPSPAPPTAMALGCEVGWRHGARGRGGGAGCACQQA